MKTPEEQPSVSQVDRDAALYQKLRNKLSRVHPSNQTPDLNLRIELTYGEIARLSTAILGADTLARHRLTAEASTAAEIATLKAENAGLREALEPFAAMGRARMGIAEPDDAGFCSTLIDGGTGDPTNGIPCDRTVLTVGDLRRAARALTPTPPVESYEQHGNDWDMAGHGVQGSNP